MTLEESQIHNALLRLFKVIKEQEDHWEGIAEKSKKVQGEFLYSLEGADFMSIGEMMHKTTEAKRYLISELCRIGKKTSNGT